MPLLLHCINQLLTWNERTAECLLLFLLSCIVLKPLARHERIYSMLNNNYVITQHSVVNHAGASITIT